MRRSIIPRVHPNSNAQTNPIRGLAFALHAPWKREYPPGLRASCARTERIFGW